MEEKKKRGYKKSGEKKFVKWNIKIRRCQNPLCNAVISDLDVDFFAENYGKKYCCDNCKVDAEIFARNAYILGKTEGRSKRGGWVKVEGQEKGVRLKKTLTIE
jgi:hypothetical protein